MISAVIFHVPSRHRSHRDHSAAHATAIRPTLATRRTAFPHDFYLSIVSFHEQVSGWNSYLKNARDSTGVVRAYRMFEGILADFGRGQVLPFDQAAASVFDSLRDQHVRVGTMDLRIAATAIAQNLTLLTRSLVDFRRVPGLRAEDWTR